MCAIVSVLVACGSKPPPKVEETAVHADPKERCTTIAAKHATCDASEKVSQGDCEKVVTCTGSLLRPEAVSGVLDCLAASCDGTLTKCMSGPAMVAQNLSRTPDGDAFLTDCRGGKFKCLDSAACDKLAMPGLADALWPSFRECSSNADCGQVAACATGVLMKTTIAMQSCITGMAGGDASAGVGGGAAAGDPGAPTGGGNDSAGSGSFPGIKPEAIGKPAPALSLTGLDGKPISLAAQAGKVVVVDFWASWCEPCKKSMPGLQALSAKYKKRGLVVIGISEDDEASSAKAFAKAHPVKYALACDDNHKTTAAAWKPSSMPARALVDRKGVVRFVQQGFSDGDIALLEKQIQSLL